MLRIWIGWDSRFPEPAKVLAYSIWRHATVPVDLRFLELQHLENVYGFQRDPDPKASTEFTYSRFLVPRLCNYQGKALFLDNDMLCVADVAELAALPMDGLALRVTKHDHQVEDGSTKMYGAKQYSYPRKNWSSMMILACDRLRSWTKNAVERQSGAYLHRFEGIHDSLIGELPKGWNELTHMTKDCKLLHYTLGGPWYKEYLTCPHADLWFQYREWMFEDIAKGRYP